MPIEALALALALSMPVDLAARTADTPGPACSDAALQQRLADLIGAASVAEDGKVVLTREPADVRFDEPYSGVYFQITHDAGEPMMSRSLWDRRLRADAVATQAASRFYNSDEFAPERLRVAERLVRLPSSHVRWRFQVALAC